MFDTKTYSLFFNITIIFEEVGKIEILELYTFYGIYDTQIYIERILYNDRGSTRRGSKCPYGTHGQASVIFATWG